MNLVINASEAIGDQSGTVTILELCDSLYTMQKNEKEIMTDIFTREMTKEKNLESLRKLQELEKKRIPKDYTAIQKKFAKAAKVRFVSFDPKL